MAVPRTPRRRRARFRRFAAVAAVVAAVFAWPAPAGATPPASVSITVSTTCHPADDPGGFVFVNSATGFLTTSVPCGGVAAAFATPWPGSTTITEGGNATTDLAQYSTSVACVYGNQVIASANGPSVTLSFANVPVFAQIACEFSNFHPRAHVAGSVTCDFAQPGMVAHAPFTYGATPFEYVVFRTDFWRYNGSSFDLVAVAPYLFAVASQDLVATYWYDFTGALVGPAGVVTQPYSPTLPGFYVATQELYWFASNGVLTASDQVVASAAGAGSVAGFACYWPG